MLGISYLKGIEDEKDIIMLVRVTNHCTMGCSHCLVEASPGGAHMSMDTYVSTLDFIKSVSIPIIMLSGGEPTDHPQILEMMDRALSAEFYVMLLSNGLFIGDPRLKEEVLSRNCIVQITNDPRFYPKSIPNVVHEKIAYEHHIRAVSPFGRALKNNIPTDRISPPCFNLRSLCRTFNDFRKSVNYLRSMAKMCTPSINYDGTIVAGETPFCTVLGNVRESTEQSLTEALVNMRCARCGLVNNLTTAQKQAIGE